MEKTKFTDSEKEELRQYFDEYDDGKKNFLTLKEVENVFEKEFGIKNFLREDIIELLKQWQCDCILKITEMKSSDDLPINFKTFIRLLDTKIIKSKNIPILDVLKNISLNEESSTLSISEVKYYLETKLGEKIDDDEMRQIFNVVTQKDKNEIEIEDLIREIEKKNLYNVVNE